MFCKCLISVIVLLLITSTQSQKMPLSYASLLGEISPSRIHKNVAISPLSIGTALALTYIGAEGKTAEALSFSLGLGSAKVTKENAAHYYQKLLGHIESNSKLTLRTANRVYVSHALQLAPKFQKIALKYLGAKGEEVNFGDKKKTTDKINHWVESQTNNKIKNLVSSEMLNQDTAVFLVNAIYLKAKWAKAFDKAISYEENFDLSKTSQTQVVMMHKTDKFEYASLPELDATAVSLPYAEDEVKMLLVLPNKVDGLGNLLKQLEAATLGDILRKLNRMELNVGIPKFKFEFEILLKETLEKLGLGEVFSSAANLSSLFKNRKSVAVSEVIHKAFIDVNEEGTEAAAATGAIGIDVKAHHTIDRPYFVANHPFFFAIYSDETVIFAGHVANPSN